MPRGPAKSAPLGRCPICGKPATEEFRPFCSARCADVDLNRWLSGSYRIPAEPVADDGDPADAAPSDGRAGDDDADENR